MKQKGSKKVDEMKSSYTTSKDQTPNSSLNKFLPYALYAFLPLAFIHFYYNPFSFPPAKNILISSPSPSPPPPPPVQEVLRQKNVIDETSCDYTIGEWVQDKSSPLYNGTSCETIKAEQNCMVYGRPDRDYLHWKWKPKDCKLPKFDPKTFLKLLKNKHIAFVGDSLARNQLESLLCMTATVAKPNLFYHEGVEFRKWYIPDYKINVSIYWSPFFVKGLQKTSENDFNTLYLETVNDRWADDLKDIDMLVLSGGHWFLHRAVFNYGGVQLGCHFVNNCTEVGIYDAFSKALTTSFESIIHRKRANKGVISVFLTTYTPAHFVGDWDALGACKETQPFKGNEVKFDGMNEEMRKIGVEAVKEAKLKAREYGEGIRFEAVDVSKLAFLRPDGHPGPYMNPFPFANGVGERVQNDCVHWCLPGAIDTWNEILLDMIKRGRGEYKEKR